MPSCRGTVSYREKIVYGPDATLVVYLVDTSGPESPLEVELQKLDNPAAGHGAAGRQHDRGHDHVADARSRCRCRSTRSTRATTIALKAAIIDHGRPVMATANPPLVLTKGRPFQVELEVSPVAN